MSPPPPHKLFAAQPRGIQIDKLGYKPGQNTIYVFEAYNSGDISDPRLKLKDLSVGWIVTCFSPYRRA